MQKKKKRNKFFQYKGSIKVISTPGEINVGRLFRNYHFKILIKFKAYE